MRAWLARMLRAAVGWLNLTPRIVCDEEDTLIVEGSHLGRGCLILLAPLLMSPFVAAGIQSRSLTTLLVGAVLGAFIAGLPFLLVLIWSYYLRFEVKRGEYILSTFVYRTRPPRSLRITWENVERIVYSTWKQYRRGGIRTTHMRLTLHTMDGQQRVVLTGWHGKKLASALRRCLREKFDTETSSWNLYTYS